MAGFIILGRLATFNSVTRPNRVRLRYGSQVCFPGFRRTDCSAPLQFRYTYERAIYMVNSSQFTRSARLSLVFPRREALFPADGRRTAAVAVILAELWGGGQRYVY